MKDWYRAGLGGRYDSDEPMYVSPAESGATYFYYFCVSPSGSPYPAWVGADHIMDVFFTLGNGLHDNTHYQDWSFTQAELELSKKMMKYWANFAKTG